VHMIPNELYERLRDQGVLDNEFPSEKKTPVELVIEDLPSTLQDRGKAILDKLCKEGDFKWNSSGEIQITGKLYPNSDITKLLSTLVHESPKFYLQTGNREFLQAVRANVPIQLFSEPQKPRKDAPQDGKGQCRWTRFEEKFKF